MSPREIILDALKLAAVLTLYGLACFVLAIIATPL